jgi:hypothetical protein
MDRMDDKLDALWAEYRAALPDPDPGAQFMPNLWRRIDDQRMATTSVFRRLSQLFVVAAAALTLLMAAVVIPRFQSQQVYSASYIDVLAAAHSGSDYTDFLK